MTAIKLQMNIYSSVHNPQQNSDHKFIGEFIYIIIHNICFPDMWPFTSVPVPVLEPDSIFDKDRETRF